MSISQKERAERYYAFNLEKAKERRHRNKKVIFNFNNIHKGFYDELLSFDEKIKKERLELNNSKSKGIKESVYTNVKIPDVWKNRINYQNDLINTMNDDKFFVTYLGKGGKYYLTNEHKSPKKEKQTEKQNISEKQNKNQKIFSSTYNSSFNTEREKSITFNLNETVQPHKKESAFKSILKKNNEKEKEVIYDEDESFDYKEKYQKLKSETREKMNKLYEKGAIIANNKDIVGILEEYKQAYPISLPKIKHGNDNILEEQNKENQESKEETKSLIKHQKNLIILKPKEKENELKNKKSYETSIRKKKSEPTKGEVFRQTIYNNLLSKNTHNNLKDPALLLKEYINTMEKNIEITNPDIKKRLEEINYWGPFYPYCFIGRKKNLLFYKTMEQNQCITLLNYLKKIKVKPKIGIKVDEYDNEFDDDEEEDY